MNETFALSREVQTERGYEGQREQNGEKYSSHSGERSREGSQGGQGSPFDFFMYFCPPARTIRRLISAATLLGAMLCSLSNHSTSDTQSSPNLSLGLLGSAPELSRSLTMFTFRSPVVTAFARGVMPKSVSQLTSLPRFSSALTSPILF